MGRRARPKLRYGAARQPRPSLEELRELVADALVDLEDLFIDGVKLTFISRFPGNDEADLLISADETLELRALCDRFLAREAGAVEMVATAAIRVAGEVWTLPRPARHHILVHAWSDAHYREGAPARIGKHEQGFVTSRGRFVGRAEAAAIAHAAGQLASAKPTLFSEDLW